MALDTRAILGIQNVNALQSLQAGQLGMQAHDFGRKNALDALITQNAGGLMNGDASALAALAGHGADGLQMANGMQQQQIANARADRQEALVNRREDRLDEQFKFQIAEALKSAETQQIAAEQEKLAGVLKSLAVVHAEGDPTKFDAAAQQLGMEGVTFDNFPMHAAQTQEVYELYQSELDKRPDATNYIVTGQGAADLGLDPSGSYNVTSGPEGMKATRIGGGDTNVTVHPPGDLTDKFYETADAAQAKMFEGLLNEGMNVPSKIASIDELGRLLETSPSGTEAALKSWLGNTFGMETEGLSTLQAANAIISRLVPEQRQPGSGEMSDADLQLFKQSLPRLINTPEGNAQIIATLRGIAVYQQKQAEIANRVFSRQMTPAEGREALMSLDNPLNVYRQGGSDTQIQGTWQDLGDGVRIRRVD